MIAIHKSRLRCCKGISNFKLTFDIFNVHESPRTLNNAACLLESCATKIAKISSYNNQCLGADTAIDILNSKKNLISVIY